MRTRTNGGDKEAATPEANRYKRSVIAAKILYSLYKTSPATPQALRAQYLTGGLNLGIISLVSPTTGFTK